MAARTPFVRIAAPRAEAVMETILAPHRPLRASARECVKRAPVLHARTDGIAGRMLTRGRDGQASAGSVCKRLLGPTRASMGPRRFQGQLFGINFIVKSIATSFVTNGARERRISISFHSPSDGDRTIRVPGTSRVNGVECGPRGPHEAVSWRELNSIQTPAQLAPKKRTSRAREGQHLAVRNKQRGASRPAGKVSPFPRPRAPRGSKVRWSGVCRMASRGEALGTALFPIPFRPEGSPSWLAHCKVQRRLLSLKPL